jgi:hypothetical protein
MPTFAPALGHHRPHLYRDFLQCSSRSFDLRTAASSFVYVEVTLNGASYTTNAVKYTYYQTPTLTYIKPTQQAIAGGYAVTLTGANFFASPTLICKFGAYNSSSVVVLLLPILRTAIPDSSYPYPRFVVPFSPILRTAIPDSSYPFPPFFAPLSPISASWRRRPPAPADGVHPR